MSGHQFTHGGHTYVVDRGVFDPVRHLSGVAFADHLGDALASIGCDGARVVDVGTGCGLLAVTAAKVGCTVVATDISAAAVQCAARNTTGWPVDVRQGDLFEPLGDEHFDVVVVNPPYEVGRSRPWANATVRSPDFLARFASQWAHHGQRLIIGFPADDEALLADSGLAVECWRTVATDGRPLGLYLA